MTPSPSLADAQSAVLAAAERVGPSVVGLGRGWRTGSGVVIAPNRVATVAHSVRGEETTVTFAGGRTAEARVAGVDVDANLAVLEVDTGDAPAVEVSDEAPGLGAPVLALADPGGRGLRVTLGFVTTASRSLRGARGRRLTGAIEHTAPLPRGSSGGPLVDAEGRVVALNAVRLDGGLILAVPAEAPALERLAAGEHVERRRLGVALAPPRVARRMRRAVGLPEREGLLVRAVRDGSPADTAGLKRGDLLVAVNGSEEDRLDTLHAFLDSGAPTLELGVVRGTDELTLSVTF